MPRPRSVVDDHFTDKPSRPIPSKKKLGFNRWVMAKQFIKPFWYTTEENETAPPRIGGFRVPAVGTGATPAVGAVGSTRRATIKITADAHFEEIKLTCVAYDAEGNPQNDFLMAIAEGGSDRILMNYPVHMLTMTGTGQMPFILSTSLLVKRASILTITFTLLQAITTYVYLTLHGTKYFITELQSLTTRPIEDWGVDERL